MRSLFLVLLSLISYPELGAQISTPLLTDGSKTELISFRVPTTAKKKTLKSVEFVLTGATNIDEISLEHHRGSGNRPFATSKKLSEKITLSGGLDFSPGNHLYGLYVRLKPGTDLLQSVVITSATFHYADGSTAIPNLPQNPQRLALK